MTATSYSKLTTLATLPPEILVQIVTHITTAKELCYLSLVCKRLHTFIENDGFRVFSQTLFPYVQSPSTHTALFWRDALHGLITQAQNWDRKAFIAWIISSELDANQKNGKNRRHTHNAPRGQTMGFIPVIDSYEAWYGGDWSSRKEIVAWAAGADLVVRTRTMGRKAQDMWNAAVNRSSKDFNAHHHTYKWANYHEPGVNEGLDDITFVKLLQQASIDDLEQFIIGRVSGALELVSLNKNTSQSQVQCSFTNKGRPVRSATTNGAQTLLAACVSDSIVSLYSISSSTSHIALEIAPVAETSANPSGQVGRTWTSRFLSNDRLAVGYGPAQQTIRIYNVGRGELASESQGLFNPEAGRHVDDSTSVYSLSPIAASSSAGGTGGDIFLSGAYDGLVRLHDLRSASPTVAIFRDPVDVSPIYSLLPLVNEQFVAGGGRHSIMKVFDLRMPGSELYSSTSNRHSTTTRRGMGNPKRPRDQEKSRFNWNTFLPIASKSFSRSTNDSSVYALSRPSHCSPTLYAGLQSTIVQIDIVSIMDQHPDTIFDYEPAKTGNRLDVKAKWDPEGKVSCLPMYEHTDGAVTLMRQQPVDYYAQSKIEGWDERWQRT